MQSLIEDGLSRPWWVLTLPAPLEAKYHATVAPVAGWYLQSWLLVFIAFNILSLKVDLDAFGAEAVAVPAGLTLGIFVPLALAAILVLRGHPSSRKQTLAVLVTSLVDMAIVLNSAWIVPTGHADTYLILAAIVPLVVGMIAPMPFRHSLWFCGCAFGLYVVSVLALGLSGPNGSGVPLLVASLILVPLKLAYSREWETKRSFLFGLREKAQAAALAEANARLTILSETDPLTGVANRRLFTERLDGAWDLAAAQRDWFSVLLVDIDRFKLLNDTAGHAVGDDCLIRIAEALRGPVEAGGGLVARYGGEEFVAFLPRTASEAARAAAEALRRIVADLALPHPGLPGPGIVTISIGVATAHGAEGMRGLGSGDLLKAADEALYAAKRQGRNRVEAALPAPEAERVTAEPPVNAPRALAPTCLVSVAPRTRAA
ncbi:GGDEF domain-containing protein [Methylobacterium planeticum]|uniref:diguanylate cyclase n=1 Tax=Methylobacterium planeticum TaxID=2615211 RepID=A0A6N6MSY3_9HYPH|nr:diguanylate cyclase [Methylobacterium planeticum]KAB1073635.1 GGDEF domain-containing protein [Methylobacterium planeticum]